MTTTTHREQYPEQYRHPLVGQLVTVPGGKTGHVTRLVQTRFGTLAILDGDARTAYRLSDCQPTQPGAPAPGGKS